MEGTRHIEITLHYYLFFTSKGLLLKLISFDIAQFSLLSDFKV